MKFATTRQLAEGVLPGREFTPPAERTLGRYHMRFARTQHDLEQVCRLRFAIFNLELNEGLEESYATGLDHDEFDAQCQHLIVEDMRTGEIVGTYRMQVQESAVRGAGYYSDTEFDFSAFPAPVLAESVELGRACVAREHRGRGVLLLLWCGLAQYLLHNRRSSFFGCSSLTSQNPAEGLRFYDQLRREGREHPALHVTPRIGFECIADAPMHGKVKTPELFGIYLKYGASILGPPAIDRTFGTIDFLTFHTPTPKQLTRLAGP